MGATVTSKILWITYIRLVTCADIDLSDSLWLPEQPIDHAVYDLLLEVDTAVSVNVVLLDRSHGLSEQAVGS